MRVLILFSSLCLMYRISATVDTLASELGALASNPLESLVSDSGIKSEFEGLTNLMGTFREEPLVNKLMESSGSSSKDLKSPFKKPQMSMGIKPLVGTAKILKAAPLKKVALTKAVKAKVLVPKVIVPVAALKMKPKVHELKPIVHVIEKPVPVYHKVPVPKKVLVPKFYPVYKPIPVPKIVPVPFKVPVKKIIPKIVKIPKPFIVKKFVPVKKPVPIGIPYPVPKFYKVPVPKPVPYPKFIPIPIKKKVPKFIPVPVKKIIKVPKPYYVPVKVPHITTSYMKTPMVVKVPEMKKKSFFKDDAYSGLGSFPMKSGMFPGGGKIPLGQSLLSIIPNEDKAVKAYKLKDSAKDFAKLV